MVEEAGEFAGAYRRWRGYARRPGSREAMEEELVDVVISSFFAADDYGIDLHRGDQSQFLQASARMTRWHYRQMELQIATRYGHFFP